MPYQNLIDYANSRGGLTFWAHPEVSNVDKTGPVGIETDEHSDYLLKTRDYTGFAVFYEGFKKVGNCRRNMGSDIEGVLPWESRKSPIWAIGALAFDRTGDLALLMNDVRTVLLCDAHGRAGCARCFEKRKDVLRRGEKILPHSSLINLPYPMDRRQIEKTMGESSMTAK